VRSTGQPSGSAPSSGSSGRRLRRQRSQDDRRRIDRPPGVSLGAPIRRARTVRRSAVASPLRTKSCSVPIATPCASIMDSVLPSGEAEPPHADGLLRPRRQRPRRRASEPCDELPPPHRSSLRAAGRVAAYRNHGCLRTGRVWLRGEIPSIFFAAREAGSGPSRKPRLAGDSGDGKGGGNHPASRDGRRRPIGALRAEYMLAS
jgi:hypothetical protein